MTSLVQRIRKTNNVSRNVFDVSNNIDFVTCAGQLLPVRCDDVLPGSEYRFNQSYFMRTLPLVVPAFARMKVHFDNFFIPYRLLGTDVQDIIVGNNRGMLSNYSSGVYSSSAFNKSLPYSSLFDLSIVQNSAWDSTTMYDAAGISVGKSSPVLLNALGYGVPVNKSSNDVPFNNSDSLNLNLGNSIHSVAASTRQSDTVASSSGVSVVANSLSVSILPLLCYQKVYQDFYRNKLWENENRLAYFIQKEDYGAKLSLQTLFERGILEMRYHDLDKDRIIGMVPDVSNILSAGLSISNASVLSNQGLDNSVSAGYYQNNSSLGPNQVPDAAVSSSTANASAGTLNILSLRRLEAFQKFAEITSMNKNDYKHQIRAHFGMDVPDLNSDYCQYLGGFEDIVNIADVENTTSTQAASLSGKGVSSSNSRQFTFRASEHGMLMTICYVLPLVDYSNLFMERYCNRLNRYDFAIPEFDSIGFEPVRLFDIYNQFSCTPVLPTSVAGAPASSAIVGYLPRYWDYKTKLDVALAPYYQNGNKEVSLNYGSYIIRYPYSRFCGMFSTGQMYKAFKAIPSLVDNLFSVDYGDNVEHSPFIVTFYDRCSAMLPLSVSGLPY